ncbi:unnamed protein product [Alternaria alternata]
MATGYAPQMEKIAGMHPSEQREFVDANSVKDPPSATKFDINTNVTMNTLPSTANSDSEQLRGPAEMEGLTIIWSRNWLIAAYGAIMLISFINSLQQQTNFSWRPYVTSAFLMHGLTAMTDIVANIVGGVSKLPLAMFIDLVGRPQGFLMCLIFIIACKSFQSNWHVIV